MDDGRRAVSEDEQPNASASPEQPQTKKRAAHMLTLEEYQDGSLEQQIEREIDEQLTRVYRELARKFPHAGRKQGHEVWLYVLAAHLANGAYQCCRQPAHLQAMMTATHRYWLRVQMQNEGMRVPKGTKIQ